MKQINYLKGDATKPQIGDVKCISHICNDVGGWGKGFVLAISNRWPEPEKAYRKWYKERDSNDFGLGAIQMVQVEQNLYVANMVAQHGIKRGNNGIPPLRYGSVKDCLIKLSDEAKLLGASVHMPRIGTGLAGGKWEEIEPIIVDTLIKNDIEVYVYDFA